MNYFKVTFNDYFTKLRKHTVTVEFISFRVGNSIQSFIVKDNVTSVFFTRGCKVKGR